MSVAGDVPTADEFDQSINPNGVIALRTTAQSIPNNTSTAISWDSEEFDNSSMITPTSSTITVQADGVYTITAEGAFAANATGIRGLEIVINGGSAAGGAYVTTVGAGVSHRIIYANDYLLAASDTVQINAFQTSGGALNLSIGRTSVVRATG